MPQKKAKARQTKKKSVKHRRVVKKKSSRSSPVKKTHFFVKLLQKLRTFLFGFIFAGCLTLPFYFYYLDLLVKSQFEGKRWSIPARVYARPLELYEGLKISADQFERELKYCRYHAKNSLKQSGSYQRKNNVFAVHTRPFSFGDSIEKSKKIRVEFADNQLLSVKTMQMKTLNQVVRLDPALIGSFYPQLKEDRILVRLSDIPKSLHNTLIAVEDRSFYQHHGVHVSSLLRAFWENLKAGKVVQGGSTLTQQLVKNFFLDSKRRYLRKLNEVFMAIILEWRYSKREILEAYLNEIYLGQDGSRAIHGVGKASQYYFDQNVSDLNLSQSALLVTLIRGASYYDPRRHPERALKRRNRILDGLYQQKKIKKWGWKLAKQSSLGVTKKAKGSSHLFPAYLDLVKRQLRENYKEEDLTSEGLQIFTSLDPIVQYEVEQAIFNGLTTLEKSRWHHREKLQSAAVVTDTVSGDVLALVGGRNYRYAGFNRAIDANRPIGSLIKPIVYLSAVTEPAHYN
ncbi:MAG: penicillin-binding protein 1B, partial [Methylococcales bacterium]|nr:penicillin-binding protein 1B [Methylococcales bacterium]